MVKQAKTKKGSIGKKALAALLAVSMVLSSSAFTVFASEAEPSKDIPATAEVTVKLNDTSSDSFSSSYTGEQVKAASVSVEVAGSENRSEGSNQQPVEGEDYTYTWGTNINAGTDAGSITVRFRAPESPENYNYSALGTKTFTFDITPKNLSNLSGEELKYDVGGSSFAYKGTPQAPKVSNVRIVSTSDQAVKHTLVKGQDYEIVPGKDKDMISASKTANNQSIVIKGKNNYSTDEENPGDAEITYWIQQVKLEDRFVTVTSDDILWESDLEEADIQKKVYAVNKGTDKKLIDDTDCDYEYKNTDEPDTAWGPYDSTTDGTVGEHQFRIKATSSSSGNYNDGFVQGVYRIIPSSFEDAVKDVESVTINTSNVFIKDGKDNPDLVYTGSDLCDGSIAVTLGGNLTQDTDFKVVTEPSEEEWINAGDYDIELQGIGNYVGKTAKIPVKINPYSLSDDQGEKKADVDVTATAGQTRNKVMTEVSLEVKDNRSTVQEAERELKSPKDYSYEVKSKTENGETVNYLVISGAGNYTGSFEADITNTGKLPLSDETYISANVKKEFNWNDKVTIGSDDIEVYDVEQNAKLEYGTDYVIKSNPTNIKAGTNIVTIKAMDSSQYYEGERDVEFYVKGEAKYDTIVSIDTIAPIKKADAATMDNIRGKIKVRLIREGGTITEASNANDHAREKYYLRILDKDDKEVYVTGGTNSGSLDTGTYKVEVTDAEGRYEGPVTATFTVEGEAITAPVVENVKEYTYTGEPIIPTDIKVYKDVSSKDTPLKYGEDYDITAEDNINAGQVQATITFKGDYSGSTKVNFKINQAAGSAGLREAQKNALANGMNVGDADCVPKLVGYIGGREVNDTTLKVANMTSSDPDVAKITDEGAIKYVSKGTATVTITPASENLTGLKAFDVTVKVTGGSASAGIKTPTFTPSNKISKKAKTFTVTTSTVKGATKWQVRYSLKDLTQTLTGSKYVTVKNKTKLKRYVVKCKKSKKKYYIRVRAYVKGKGWSDWSPQKSIKTR